MTFILYREVFLHFVFVPQVELFKEVLESCGNVLKKDPDNVKALFRSGKVCKHSIVILTSGIVEISGHIIAETVVKLHTQ